METDQWAEPEQTKLEKEISEDLTKCVISTQTVKEVNSGLQSFYFKMGMA